MEYILKYWIFVIKIWNVHDPFFEILKCPLTFSLKKIEGVLFYDWKSNIYFINEK